MLKRYIILGCTLLLLGAGCVKQDLSQIPPSDRGIDAEDRSEANLPVPSIEQDELPPPPQIEDEAQVSCSITSEIVKTVCKISEEVSSGQSPCTFKIKMSGSTFYEYPILKVNIATAQKFGAPAGSNLTGVLTAQRESMNKGLEKAKAYNYGMYPCDRWETKAVSGLGDEALMTPLVLLGCEESRVSPISDLKRAPNLFIRKGSVVAQVASYESACSPDEITQIARQYVLPAMQ